MSERANVESVDAIKLFRAALVKFAEAGSVALTAGESDIDRTLAWLERDQTTFWAGELRKRHAMVLQCEDAVRQKRIFKAPDGSQQSVVDEMKALQRAKLRREEAEAKTLAVRKAITLLRKEGLLYKGKVQRLAGTLQVEVPRAVRLLDGMLDHLDEYLSLAAPEMAGLAIAGAEPAGASMAQASMAESGMAQAPPAAAEAASAPPAEPGGDHGPAREPSEAQQEHARADGPVESDQGELERHQRPTV